MVPPFRSCLCYLFFPPTATVSGLTLFDKFIARLVFARRRRRGRTSAERGRQTRPERTAHGVRLSLTVCLDQGVKLALVLSNVLLFLPVEGLRLATLGFEVCQGQRGRVLGVRRVCEWSGGEVGKGVRVLTFSLFAAKRELTVKSPLLRP